MGGVSLIEFLKNMLSGFRINAAAGIADGNDHIPFIGLQCYSDGAARPGELHRIGEQIVPHQTQQFRIGSDSHIILNVGFDFQILFLPDILESQQVLAQLFPQFKLLGLGENLLIFQFVQFQNVGNQRSQPPGTVGDGPGILDAVLFGKSRLPEHGRVVAHHCQRCFQFMGYIGDKVCPEGFRAL